MYFLDTCTLLWWTLDKSCLSKKANKLFSENKKFYVSSISIWEIGVKHKNKKINLPFGVKEYAEKLKRLESLEIISVDTNLWIENLNLDWQHKDPVDRTIVATAKSLQLPIITPDKEIKRFYKKTVW